MNHVLKCWSEYFRLTWAKVKPVEIRLNDRNYQPGDTFTLCEYDPKSGKFSGRKVHGKIWHVYGGFPGLKDKHVVLFYDETGREEAPKISFEDESK